jgi:hypothetical protein
MRKVKLKKKSDFRISNGKSRRTKPKYHSYSSERIWELISWKKKILKSGSKKRTNVRLPRRRKLKSRLIVRRKILRRTDLRKWQQIPKKICRSSSRPSPVNPLPSMLCPVILSRTSRPKSKTR